ACLIVAPPGTGKTASIALPNLFSIHNSVVVLDIKGELYQKSAGFRQQNFGHKILRFSPLNTEENTMYFNPFDRKVVENLDYVEQKELADQIAGTIFVGEKGKENDHWVVSAKTMFSFYATYFMQKNGGTSLGELAQAPKMDKFDFISDEIKKQFELIKEDEDTGKIERDSSKSEEKAFYTQVSLDESLHDITRNQGKSYSTAGETEFASIKSTYDTFMAVFQNPRVANATSKMSFDYYDLREEKISCYIVIQSEDIDILAPLIRIFVETMFKKLMSGKENSDPDKFVYFIGDEFVRFGKMPYLLEAPALCRSYGLIPIYITQSYEQIKKYYGEDDLNILRSNVGYQVVFTMNSAKDAEELSKMIGKFTRKKLSTSKGNLDLIKSNDSISSEGYELVPAQDILNMPNTDILILIRGFVKHPIKAKVNFWFKNKEWNGADKIPVKSEEELQQEKILSAQEEKEESKQETPAEDLKQEPITPKPRIQAVIDTREKIARINALKKAKEDLQKTQESLEKQGLEEIQELDKEESQESQENTQNPNPKESQESQESQEIPQDSKEQEERNKQEVQEKEALIEQELGKEGLKEFFMTLINKCGNCETEEEHKSLLKTFQNQFYNNEMPLEKIKQIIETIKEEQEEDTA
ncbi:MAG: type IV secretory system conjugative DNA transfer family protein, partial [Lachnospiraceae bacterium]|nr:type IV secretory system conjugative DNA transfer family protein [Lachnospiraceae bacterium]